MALLTYYFDAHLGFTDVGSAFTNDANAFDGSTSTFASCTAVAGGELTDYLYGKGTTSPMSSPLSIVQVQARAFYSSPDGSIGQHIMFYTTALGQTLGTITSNEGSPAFTSYITLTPPTAGWTWSTINLLETKLFVTTSDSGGFNVYRVEVAVTTLDMQLNNYQFVKAGNGMSTTEKIR